MGRFLLCGKEAALPYEVEEMDLRLYSAEELACFIYDNLSLIDEDFMDSRLLLFIREELELTELSDKLKELKLPDEQDAALFLILSATGYHTEAELNQFKERLEWRKRKSAEERLKEKADILFDRGRYHTAVRAYRELLSGSADGRMPEGFYEAAKESLANACGQMSEFGNAEKILTELFQENGSERVLHKLYDTCRLAGDPFPEERFAKFADRFSSWAQDFDDRKAAISELISEDPVLGMFEKDGPEAREAFKKYTETKKEEYRSMLE
ncbi:MAG: hypothetical protein IJL78_08000 [Lachnospiraceae bacterium]|nr:hypothetical protein [Lachnospiraceae bacterium]